MKSFSKKVLAGTTVAAVALAGSIGTLVAQEKPVIATVVKISGIPWFDRMNTGVVAYQDANPDVVASQSGPATADSAQQLQIVNDLVAKGVNALAVVPMDPAVLEGTFQRAMERGIVVVTHEADNQMNTNADVEAFDNADYGAALNERLAEQYEAFVKYNEGACAGCRPRAAPCAACLELTVALDYIQRKMGQRDFDYYS